MSFERLLPLAMLALLTACEIENVTIAQTEARVATHGVLSATATTQVILLERTRTGAVSVSAPPFELEDPFGSDAGIAESFATISLTTPDGLTLVAREDNRGGGVGRGVYRFNLPGDALERRRTYKLSVLTIKGEILSAETSVPDGIPAVAAEQRAFDRSLDTVVVEWPAAPGARSYFVRIETPFGPRSFFTDSTRVRLTGELRNVDVASLPRVFIPGFPQAVTVSAVDSNYYDWYRTRNDPISGEGLVNRVQGGIGVFGSLVRLRMEQVHVVAPQTTSIAGNYVIGGSDLERAIAPYLTLTLYIESPSSRSDQPDLVSGRFIVGVGKRTGCGVCGLFGTVQGGTVSLAMLETGVETKGWSARDTLDVFNATVHGDTLIGKFRFRGGPFLYIRER